MEMTTRERIVREALHLFSQKGYSGTSVKKIADAVGIKDASLYKHFCSKREIFDTIVREMGHQMELMGRTLGLPDDNSMEKEVAIYSGFSEDQLVELSRKVFLYYLKDEFAAEFRHMLTIEQYHDPELFAVYRRIFMEDSIRYLKELFAGMMQNGAFIAADPEAVAMNFYAPIFFLLTKYDQDHSGEKEALEELDRQLREFVRIYKTRA